MCVKDKSTSLKKNCSPKWKERKTRMIDSFDTITKENSVLVCEIINKLASLSAEQKFEMMIERIDEDLVKELINSNVNTWEEFERMIKRKSIYENKIVEIYCIRRMTEESCIKFARKIKAKLKEFNVSESTIIKHLSINIWPGRTDVSVLLTLNQNYDDFEARIN
ncbi:hypothetical protein NGRA_1827 [Nosema granulosis]|uniref:Uncharacterized protein n=1 Tax=Nosema granulosis TaxID=83296 RepID=A0A9P6GXP9_9MICR|nr:hypothetical protein NGRA_1827 [Nosema granulosis]